MSQHKILNSLLAGEKLNKFITNTRFSEVELHAVIPRLKTRLLIPIESKTITVTEDGQQKTCSEYWIDESEIKAYHNDREAQKIRQAEAVRQSRINWHVKRFKGSADWICEHANEVRNTVSFKATVRKLTD